MRKSLALVLICFVQGVSASESLPLDNMKCSGPFQHNFFENLTSRPDLNDTLTELGKHPDTFYKFELASDVFTSPPTFKSTHTEEYVFLSTDDKGLSISRFVILNNILILLAQHPAEFDLEKRVLQYRTANPDLEPDWTCTY